MLPRRGRRPGNFTSWRNFRAAAAACALLLAGCGGGGSSSGSGAPVPTPVPTQTPNTGPVLQTVASWHGASHSAAAAAGEPLELGVPTSVTATTAALGTVQAGVVDGHGSQVTVTGTTTVTVANPALATIQVLPASSLGGNLTDVAIVSAAGTVAGSTTVTVTAPGALPATIPLEIFASLGVESTPSRDAGFAWNLQNGALVRVAASPSDVYVAWDRTTTTTFNFPYGYQRFPSSTAVSSIPNALSFTPDGTTITAPELSTNLDRYGVIVFKTASGEYVKARVVAATCQGSAALCEGGATLESIAVASRGGIFPY